MKFIKENDIYKLFNLLSKKRRRGLYFIFILLIFNSIAESFSLFTLIPLLSIFLSTDNKNFDPFLDEIFNFLNINNNSQILLILTISFCFGILFSTLFKLLNNWCITRITAKINIDLSYAIFRNNIYQSYTSYLKKNSAEILSLVIEKTSMASGALSSLLYLLTNLIISFVIIFSLFIYSWKIMFLSLLVLVIYYVSIYQLVKKRLLNNGEKIAINDPKKIMIIQESMGGFRELAINGTQEIFIKLFKKYMTISRISAANAEFTSFFPRAILEAILFFSIAIIGYSFSKPDANINKIEILTILGAFIYALQRLLPMIQQIYTSLAGLKVKYTSIRFIIADLECNKASKGILIPSKNLVSFKENIVFKDINYSYEAGGKSKNILENINLKINKGECIGIFGETGSGKSTFLDILMGLIKPSNGNLYIDNIDISRDEIKGNWTLNISHVPQSIFLRDATIAENIAFGESLNTIDFELLERASQIAHIYNFIKKRDQGFMTKVGERGIRLSGGQRQRIAIARAIYQNKNLLVLDEATSALDENTEKNIINSIIKNRKELTIIMVTHRIKSLLYCDKVFEIKDKKVLKKNNLK
tara:strand:+ start:64 stop:1830 length:1767 start_codon:yes stop_codon:yes gene_type:complete